MITIAVPSAGRDPFLGFDFVAASQGYPQRIIVKFVAAAFKPAAFAIDDTDIELSEGPPFHPA
jgi:hypothetical protein